MAQFNYAARDAHGQPRSGVMEAPDRASALHTLSQQFDMVLRLERSDSVLGRGFWRGHKVTTREVMVFTQQLAAMTEGGVALPRAFDLLVQEARSPRMRDTVLDLLGTVRSGEPLSAGLRHHPNIFPSFYCAMVEAGERSGNLPGVLFRVSDFLERMEKLRSQVIGALIYPSIVLVFAALATALILVVGVPQISSVYGELGRPLPAMTRVFVDSCMFLARTWWLWLGGLFFGGLVLRRLMRLRVAKRLTERLLLRTWPVSGLAQDLAMSRFSQTMATLHAAGLRMDESLDLVASVVGFQGLAEELRKARDRVLDGEPLSVALRRARMFTTMVVGMIAVGEESGTLDRMLTRLAHVYEAQVEVGLRALVAAVEPLLVIGVGLLIAGLLFVLGLPFLNLASSIS